MAKLRKLLAKQDKLATEVAGLDAFLATVNGHAPLELRAGDEVIIFEPQDITEELPIIQYVAGMREERAVKLAKANRKVAALEELASE